MKKSIIEFILYIYLNYIQEDWYIFNTFGKIYIFLPWLVRSIMLWILSPLFIPEFLIIKSQFYKLIKNNLNLE